MSAPFVPNQQLLSLQTTGLPGLSGTTLPRSILADQGWPDALIEDYDAKGLNSGENGSTLTLLGEQTHQAQVWNRENQRNIDTLQNQINAGEIRLAAAESQVRTLSTQVSTLSTQVAMLGTTVTALNTRVDDLDADINRLEMEFAPLTGTATPEGAVTSNRSQTYYQIDGMTTDIFFNPAIGVNTGWVQMT